MQNLSKPAVVNNRQLALEWMALVARAFAGGLLVSVAAALLIVCFVSMVA